MASATLALRRLPWRRLLWPGVWAALLLALLVTLGVWQLHRLRWKLGILAAIHAAEFAPPIPLPAQPTPFEKVGVRGVWLRTRAALYGDIVHTLPQGEVQGGDLIMALLRKDGPPVLVDRGWVPETLPRPLADPPGEVLVAGFVEPPARPGWLSAPDDPAKRLFYTRDPARIGTALGLPRVAPMMLMALGPRRPGRYPWPRRHLPHPPNNHLQYAWTWFGLALVLVVEFFWWAAKRLRE